VCNARIWGELLGIEHVVIEGLEHAEGEELLIAHVRVPPARRGRCGRCQWGCPGHDGGEGRRR
jgi:hypothetical protein